LIYSLQAPAKLNLFLTILAREAGGFHQLETAFAAVDLFDELTLELKGGEIELTVEGANLGDPTKNLVYEAAEVFMMRAGLDQGVSLTLTKRIPHGAGLGGGSSDAAAALRLLQHAFRSPLSEDAVLEMAGELGSDVPFFLSPSPLALAWGRGDRMFPLPVGVDHWVVLALPSLQIATPWAYRTLAEARAAARTGWPGGTLFARRADARGPLELESIEEMGRRGNHFEKVVFEAHPVLKSVRGTLEELGARPARLSGSGAALFGVFEAEGPARDAARALGVLYPALRCHVGTLLDAFPSIHEEESP
jgi:4-diphosphocytidyl-2-C-methyl-D-erythritol kinase